MHITPVIPDGYDGPIKQLTCRICKHIFYVTMADYSRRAEIFYCHECSLMLAEELEKAQRTQSKILLKQTPLPTALPPKPAVASTPPPVKLIFSVTKNPGSEDGSRRYRTLPC